MATDVRRPNASLPTPGTGRHRRREAPGAPPAGQGFRPDVQGLRAIAVSIVLIYHLYPSVLPGGYVGVDVFFVISGFLITGHLLRTLERTGRVGFVDFYARRARRLMPAAVLVLAVTWLASKAVLPSTQLPATAEQIRASALYFQNWVLSHDAVSYLTADDTPSPVQHFWSLSVEEQFYLFWPLLVLFAAAIAWVATRRRSAGGEDEAVVIRRAHVARTSLFTLAVAVAAASLWFSIHETRVNPAAAYFVTTTRIWELALGGALALLAGTIAEPLGRFGPLGWAGLGLVLASVFVIDDASVFPGSIALLPVGGAVLLIACGSARARFGPSRVMSTRPMVFVGDISYSLYLWHWPIIVLWKAYSGSGIGALDGPAIAAVSIVLAWLTKVLVEDRVRLAAFFAGHKWRSLATVATAIVPVAMATVFIANQPAPYRVEIDAKHPGSASLAGDVGQLAKVPYLPPVGQAKDDGSAYGSGPGGCQTVQTATHTTPCTYGDTKHPKITVALIGDSVAGQWFTALNAIAVKQHWKLVMSLHSLCPWTAAMMQLPHSKDNYTACQTWGKTVLKDMLTKIKPDVVITTARPVLGTPEHPKPGAQAFESIAEGSARYWKQLVSAGIPVVAIKESPEMGKAIPDCLSARNGNVQRCSTATSRADPDHTPLEIATRKTGKGASMVDMNNLICAPRTCSPVVGNILVYRDDHHITKTYMVTLEPYLERKLLATGYFDT